MSSQRNFGLDVLRSHGCIVIVMMAHGALFFYHLWSDQRLLWYFGSIGMDMFFVLSGFLIGGILLDSIAEGGGWLRRFWLRRWIRTLPNYYLFLAINALLWWYSFGPLPEWPKFLFFVQNLAWEQSPLFPESWSLALEEVFYIVAPLVFLALALDPSRPRRIIKVWAIIIVASIAVRWTWVLALNPPWDDGVKKVVVARGDAIAWGLLAVQCVRLVQPSAQRIAHAALLGCGLVVVASALFAFGNEDSSIVVRVAPFAMNGAGFALILPWFARLDGSRVPAWYRLASNRLAVWSYSWYVIHLVVMRLMEIVVPDHYGFGITACKYAVYVVVSLTWSWANYTWFEKPILRWRDRLVGSSEFRMVAAAGSRRE